MKREIVQTGHAALRLTAKPVSPEDIGSARIQSLLHEMSALLKDEKYGVALAAPQVGESLRIFIVAGKILAHPEDTKGTDKEKSPPPPDQVYINPEIVKISRKKFDKHEGCLSVRGKWGIVPRAEKTTVRAYNEKGQKFERGASGFLAHIFQHEIDHLNGILYLDKAKEVSDEKDESEE